MALLKKLSKRQRILLCVLIFEVWILLASLLIYHNPLYVAHAPTQDQMYETNPFSAIAGNWSTSPPYVVEEAGSIPVTYEMITMLGKEYPCANEQLILMDKDHNEIPIQVNVVSSNSMSVGYPADIPDGAYVLHTHPRQSCGDFTDGTVVTFPSPADLLTSRKNNIDDIIVMTKVANDTAIATRVTGFKDAPISVLEQYGFVTGIIGYNEMTTLYSFRNANITSEFYTIHADRFNDTITVNRVDADTF